MSNFASNLASLARSKLHSALSGGARDNLSLHRWVLLKNSITLDGPSPTTSPTLVHAVSKEVEEVDLDIDDEDVISFLFPDPGDSLTPADDGTVTEAQWLDSLLEELGEDSDDDDADSSVQLSVRSVHAGKHSDMDIESRTFADEDFPSSPISYPYPVPYPSFHPPLIRSCDLDLHYESHFLSTADSSHYCNAGDLSTPDASEDISDDESDGFATPFPHTPSSLSLVDPTLIPLPGDRPLHQSEPRVYTELDIHSHFFSFGFDSVPSHAVDTDSPPAYDLLYQAC